MEDRVLDCIYNALETVNSTLPQKIAFSKTATLYGNNSLDSISLVLLISLIEQNLENEFHKPFILANEKAISLKNSPFLTVGSLYDYIITNFMKEQK